MAEKMGRPLSENPKTTRLEIRVTSDEKQEIMELARASGHSLRELLQIGIEAVRRENEPDCEYH